jgi:signal-transduction protein with cAMP-binding, CBS, and nucleotidyltransferase domain/DNA polymerase III epsilon subunit-like protein
MLTATLSLARCPAIALDLETTGLNVRADRIVQIGAVHREAPFETIIDCLINPRIAIPASATEIHGITAEDVAGASSFATKFPVLAQDLTGHVLIGFNTGFDLAFIEAECARAGLTWRWEGALCVRELSQIALGAEAGRAAHDLESLAHFFGIAPHGRHSAVGDARLTAQIFTALLPLLQEKGIVTLADAYFQLSGRHQWRRDIVQAGWVDILKHFETRDTLDAVRDVDTYPFRHRLTELMNQEPIILPATATALEAATRMQENHIDCVFVGTREVPLGIVSERDIVRTMAIPLDKTRTARQLELGDIMSAPLIAADKDDYLYIALGRITRHDIRHLAVTDQSGCLVGWLSARELLRHRTSAALVLGDHIQSAQQRGDLVGALSLLPGVVARLSAEGLAITDITAIISSEISLLLSRSADFAEQEMIANGHGPAPRAHAVLILGSAARRESLLAADQDHAIVYADHTDRDEIDRNWFLMYGKHISDILAEAGLPYCAGGVMSQNPAWCMSLSDWTARLYHWVKQAHPEDTLAMDIFFDFQYAAGCLDLAQSLKRVSLSAPMRRPDFLKNLARNVGRRGANIDLFGRLKFVNGQFEAKRAITLPITEALRVLALSHGLSEVRSTERAEALIARQNIPNSVLQISEDLVSTQDLILRQQLKDLAAGRNANSALASADLSTQDKKNLVRIIRDTAYLSELLQDTLFAER